MWTKEIVETMIRLQEEGLTLSMIAKELGEKFTKNMVAGKLWRIKQREMKCLQTDTKL